jgi:glyoxylase-like metal-dependent hydrolase (beta-lactamase superfamily II)
MKNYISKPFALLIICLFAICSISFAQVESPKSFNQPGYYAMQLGDIRIIALSDGTAPQDLLKLLTNVKPGEIERISKENYQATTIECSVNAYLVQTAGKFVLIDAGTSDVYGKQLGHIKESLANAGIRPEQIDAVLLTHIHMDHIGGIINGNDPAFPNATIYISSKEADFWLNAENRKVVPANQLAFFDAAQLKLLPIKKMGRLKTFEFGKELFPGITPVAAIGHTPGHTFYSVESKGQKMIFVGDILVSLPVQFNSPHINSVYDLNVQQASETRLKALDYAAKDGYWLAISHASFPGIGHVTKNGKGFNWIPINYSSTGYGQ